MFHRHRVEVEYADLYQTEGLGTTIWSPLASGILTGKYSQGIPDAARANLPEYEWLKDNILSAEGSQKIAKTKKLEQKSIKSAWNY